MNPDPSKLRHQHQQQQTVELGENQKQTVLEFASVEELIRHDAQQTEPPGIIAERLNESISHERPPEKSWWKRWFS